MRYKKSIALISCYMGELPWYFDYFLHSCKHNPTIDFFVITDGERIATQLPKNVKHIHKTLYDINSLATKALGFEIDIKYSYKLCDFKPAYGVIFSDIIERYDFWGYCDIDIIFGNIRRFITLDLLKKFDLFSIQPYWLPGCFLLFKNEPKLNTLFMNSKDYRKVFTDQIHYCFDETNFTHDQFNNGLAYRQIHAEIESMTHVVKKLEETGDIMPYFDRHIIEGRPGCITWECGKMIYKKKYEAFLYHLIDLKKHYHHNRKGAIITDKLKITRDHIFNSSKI